MTTSSLHELVILTASVPPPAVSIHLSAETRHRQAWSVLEPAPAAAIVHS